VLAEETARRLDDGTRSFVFFVRSVRESESAELKRFSAQRVVLAALRCVAGRFPRLEPSDEGLSTSSRYLSWAGLAKNEWPFAGEYSERLVLLGRKLMISRFK